MAYNLLMNGVYWGYNPLTNHLLTSRHIQVAVRVDDRSRVSAEATRFKKKTSGRNFLGG